MKRAKVLMVNKSGFPGHPPKDEFIGELVDFYHGCEPGSLGDLAKEGRRLPQVYPRLYPKYFPGTTAMTYHKSVYSRTLKGKNKGLPDRYFVMVFVLSCIALSRHREACWATDAAIDQTVRYWLRRLRVAEQRAEDLGLFIRPSFHLPRRAVEVPRFRLGIPADAEKVPPFTLSKKAWEQLLPYMPYVHIVRDRLALGDGEAFYQVALLLAAHPGQEPLALELLARAASGHHERATDLLQESPRHRLNRPLARQHAEDLADEAVQADYHDAAEAFAECAHRLEDLTWGDMPLAAPTPGPELPA